MYAIHNLKFALPYRILLCKLWWTIQGLHNSLGIVHARSVDMGNLWITPGNPMLVSNIQTLYCVREEINRSSSIESGHHHHSRSKDQQSITSLLIHTRISLPRLLPSKGAHLGLHNQAQIHDLCRSILGLCKSKVCTYSTFIKHLFFWVWYTIFANKEYMHIQYIQHVLGLCNHSL